MLKASALYIAIIIALVIAIFTASLISTAYFYRYENQKKLRYERLLVNLESGTNLLLSKNYTDSDSSIYIDLFNEQKDSLKLFKKSWGIFDVATVASFTVRDTLKKSFFIALNADKDLSAIYLVDEDRPLSISGTTRITGEAFVPKAGIQQAFVEGKKFTGTKLVNGAIKNSGHSLPPLNNKTLKEIEDKLSNTLNTTSITSLPDTLYNSFFEPTRIIRISNKKPVLNSVVKGNVLVLCDTVLTITKYADLQDILIYAKAIVIQENFKGSCQLFAQDSIIAKKSTEFKYPSCLGLIKSAKNISQAKISLAENCLFSGIIFTQETKENESQSLISIDKNSMIIGEVYANSLLKFESPVNIFGKVSCKRFIVQTPTTLYENYLIDLTINRLKRSKYYLSSKLFSGTKNSENQILKWLN